MAKLTKNNSIIRAMFEEGNRLAAEYGRENVFDFSLGNPSIPSPSAVNEAIIDIAQTENPLSLHGYMTNAGYPAVREAIAKSLNEKHGTAFSEKNIIMSAGAAGGLNVVLKTLLNPGDEVIVISPYFVEYGNYVSNFDGVLVVVPASREDFQPQMETMRRAITKKTKAVIVTHQTTQRESCTLRIPSKNWQNCLRKSQKNTAHQSILSPMSLTGSSSTMVQRFRLSLSITKTQ